MGWNVARNIGVQVGVQRVGVQSVEQLLQVLGVVSWRCGEYVDYIGLRLLREQGDGGG